MIGLGIFHFEWLCSRAVPNIIWRSQLVRSQILITGTVTLIIFENHSLKSFRCKAYPIWSWFCCPIFKYLMFIFPKSRKKDRSEKLGQINRRLVSSIRRISLELPDVPKSFFYFSSSRHQSEWIFKISRLRKFKF